MTRLSSTTVRHLCASAAAISGAGWLATAAATSQADKFQPPCAIPYASIGAHQAVDTACGVDGRWFVEGNRRAARATTEIANKRLGRRRLLRTEA